MSQSGQPRQPGPSAAATEGVVPPGADAGARGPGAVPGPRPDPSAWRTLRRILAFARPYAGLLVLVLACTLLFSAGRFGRAYLLKPLLDGVLVPVVAGSSDGTSVAPPALPAPVATSWLEEALTRVLPDDALRPAAANAGDASGAAPERAGSVRAALARILLAALLIVVVTPLALFGRAYLGAFALGRAHVDVQRRLAETLLALPLARHVGHRMGDLLARTQVDVLAVRETLRLVLDEFGVAICMLGVGIATLLYISVPLTVVSLAAAPLIAGVLIGFGRRIRRRASRRQRRIGELTGRLVGLLAGIKVVRTFGGEAAEARAFGREAERVFRADMRVVQGQVLARATVEALNSAAGFVVLGVGAVLVLQGRFGLTTGDVAAFAAVLATTYKPVKNLSKGFGRLMEQLASGERLFAVLDAAGAPPGAHTTAERPRIDRIEKGIVFEGVTLEHAEADGQRRAVLRGVDLRLERGEVVAIVGRSGAGKTSLVDLALGLYAPSAGRITVDGRPLAELDPASVRARMAVVAQEAFLFDTTIAENIRYGRPEASDAEVAEAARAAHVDEFVAALPAGLEAPVGAFGARLSGGQRQRIAIARALLRRPDVLIFDEATSALDSRTERTVREAVEALRGDRLIVIVSHRLSTVRDADRIVVVEDGRIVETGTHASLMSRDGAYRALAAT